MRLASAPTCHGLYSSCAARAQRKNNIGDANVDSVEADRARPHPTPAQMISKPPFVSAYDLLRPTALLEEKLTGLQQRGFNVATACNDVRSEHMVHDPAVLFTMRLRLVPVRYAAVSSLPAVVRLKRRAGVELCAL